MGLSALASFFFVLDQFVFGSKAPESHRPLNEQPSHGEQGAVDKGTQHILAHFCCPLCPQQEHWGPDLEEPVSQLVTTGVALQGYVI